MNAQQRHHQSAPHEFLYSIEPENFAELHLGKRAMHDALDWDEFDSGYTDESLPGTFFKETAWD